MRRIILVNSLIEKETLFTHFKQRGVCLFVHVYLCVFDKFII